jgi:hypothetical protein
MFNDEEIGMGFNSESGLTVGTALEGFTVEADPTTPDGEQFSEIGVEIANSHEELMATLGMSFEEQGRYAFFSASSNAQFAESAGYNSISTFVVARCVVLRSILRGENFSVKPQAQALLDASRFEEFGTAFGDSFVRGLQTGGEFCCVIRITSISESTQNELAATLRDEIDPLGLTTVLPKKDFEDKLAHANASKSTRSEASVKTHQRGGTGAPFDISEIITHLENFPEIIQTSPAAYETEVATYDTLPLPTPPPEEREDLLFSLRDARKKKLHYIETRNDLEFARGNPTFFEDLPSDDVLSNTIDVYSELINAVTRHAIRLSRGEFEPPRVFDPSELSPPLVEPAPIPLQRATP